MIIFYFYNVLDAMMISYNIDYHGHASISSLLDAQLDYKAALASTLRERSAISIEEGFQRFVPRLCFRLASRDSCPFLFVSPISHPKLITSHDFVSALHLVAWPCTSSAFYRFCHNQLKSHG